MMRKLSLLLLFISANVCAFAVQQDTATMITVFPTPYASYNNLYVNKQADVGLGSQCGLTTGNDSMANCPLTATNVNLMGTLNLDHFTRLNQSNSATVGNGEDSAAALQFQNIRINSFAKPVTSINAKQIAVSSTSNGLSMYPSRVTNSVDVMKECPGGVHWETLTDTNNKTGVYLVCGNSNVSQGCQPPNGQQRHTENCPSGYQGAIVYLWSTETCSYSRLVNYYCVQYMWDPIPVGSCMWHYKQWGDQCGTEYNAQYNSSNGMTFGSACTVGQLGQEGKIVAEQAVEYHEVSASDYSYWRSVTDYTETTPSPDGYPLVCRSNWCDKPVCREHRLAAPQ